MGRNKALLPWGDRTLLEAWVARFRAAGAPRIVVVVAAGSAVRSELGEALDVLWVENPDPEASGPRESLLLAATALPVDSTVWFTPVDVPVVEAGSIERVEAAYRRALAADPEGPGPIAALPSYRRSNGHPVLASPSLVSHLTEGEPGDRIDAVLTWATRRLVVVEVDDVRVVGNMNRPEDYQAFCPPVGASWDWSEQHSRVPQLDSSPTLELGTTVPGVRVEPPSSLDPEATEPSGPPGAGSSED